MSRLPAPAASARKSAASRSPAPSQRLVVLVATRKGAWLFHGDARRRAWTADGPHFLGHNISHVQLDPRDGCTLLRHHRAGTAIGGAESVNLFVRASDIVRRVPVYRLQVARDFARLSDVAAEIRTWHSTGLDTPLGEPGSAA